jgi:hypothetical protein
MSYNELIKELQSRFSVDGQAARGIIALVLDWYEFGDIE